MRRFWFILSMGFALFAMHFGAGNLVFPLTLGMHAGSQAALELLGLLVTAVGVPMLGFLSMMRYQGQARAFFSTFGKWPGFCLMTAIIAVLCPFGAIPRCIAFTHTASSEIWQGENLPLFLFCAIAVLFIFLMTQKEKGIIPLLAKVLTPLLLVSLFLILCGGIFSDTTLKFSFDESWEHFSKGLTTGYQTMDLLAALFFSGMLFSPIQEYARQNNQKPFQLACLTALVAAFLLSTVYIGFGLMAASHQALLINVAPELLLIRLAEHALGTAGSYVTLGCVIFACLTTAIALTAIFARFLQSEIFSGKMPYRMCLGITLLITYFVAILSFQGIGTFLAPILEFFYPLLIAVSFYNLFFQQRAVRASL